MINSLLYKVQKTLSGPAFNTQMFSLLAEVYIFYGKDVSCEGRLSFPAEKNSQPVSIQAAQGILLGDSSNGGLRVDIDLWCSADADTPKELAVTLETGLLLVIDAFLDDFVLQIDLKEPAMIETVATPVAEGLVLDYHRWD